MLYTIFFFILGTIFGSFLNVVIYRLPRGESVVFPPSHCPSCGKRLQASDMVPLLSYIFLKGKCSYCGAKISFRYFGVELLTGIAFVLVYMQWGFSLETVAGLLLTLVLISSAFIDFDQGIIPDKITYPAFTAGICLAFGTVGIKSALLGVLFYAGIFLIVAVLSRGGMGGGDVKLAAVTGSFTGLPGAVTAFILSALLGGLFSLILILAGRAGRKTKIRFGPFMAIGGFTAYNYGLQLAGFYLGLFNL